MWRKRGGKYHLRVAREGVILWRRSGGGLRRLATLQRSNGNGVMTA